MRTNKDKLPACERVDGAYMFSVYLSKRGAEGLYRFPWKVSIVGFMANPSVLKGKEVRETLSVIASDPFFDMVEMHLLPDEAWEEAKRALEGTQLRVASGLQPLILMEGYNPSSLEEDVRVRAVEAIKRGVEVSARRGIGSVAFCSGPDPGEGDREAAKDALVKSLKEITGYAEELGVEVILETFDRDFDKRQLIGPIDEAIEVAKEVKEEYDNFGLLWDLSHAPMLNEKPDDLRRASEHLAHIHIGCAKRTEEGLKDWHPGFYRPGSINGVEEVKDLIRVLVEIGYDGALGFEVKPEEGQVWLEVVNSAKGVLYTAYARYLSETL
ncbi:MAG: sugar phosphate isomerase/epimerase [Thermoprotei archaeon]|nr:MAG: sugar phosphate isomerase/epimerase [Thermoprotei archaeon]